METSSNGYLSTDTKALERGSIEDSTTTTLVPPYWQHRRHESYTSLEQKKPPPIILEDHIEEPSEDSFSLWAKGVAIDSYVIVSGNLSGVGDYVVWNCKVDTLDVSSSLIETSTVLIVLLFSHA